MVFWHVGAELQLFFDVFMGWRIVDFLQFYTVLHYALFALDLLTYSQPNTSHGENMEFRAETPNIASVIKFYSI
jgi:hypothetical protein